MKLCEITVGERYTARVSGRLVTVKVLGFRDLPPPWHNPHSGRWRKRIEVLNESTGRRLMLASAARLRSPAAAAPPSSGVQPPRVPAAPQMVMTPAWPPGPPEPPSA